LKSGESCSALKRHFEEGVMREIIGAWEAQLRKYPNERNFLWVDVPWTVAHTVKGHDKKVNFKERLAKKLNYGRDIVDKAYLTARQMGIVSRLMDMEIDGVIRRGFVLTPHDALCKNTDKGCLWVGPYKILGTSWRSEMGFSNGKPTGKKSVIFKGFLKAKGTELGTDKGTGSGTDKGTEPGQEEGTENLVRVGYGPSSVKVVEPIKDSERKFSISESSVALYPEVPLVSPNQRDPLVRLPRQTGDDSPSLSASDLLTKTGDDGVIGNDTRAKTEAVTADKKPPVQTETVQEVQETNHPFVEQLVRPAAAAPGPTCTIAEHFSQVEVSDDWKLRYLQVATDGLLTFDPQNKNVWGQSLDKELTAGYEKADIAIRKAVERIGHAMMIGRKSLVEVLNMAINEMPTKKLPKPVFKVMKQLAESGGAATLRAAKKHAPAPKIEPLTSEETKARIAAWNDFNESAEGQAYKNFLERGEAFEKIWSTTHPPKE
jgi:hypothetical protein